ASKRGGNFSPLFQKFLPTDLHIARARVMRYGTLRADRNNVKTACARIARGIAVKVRHRHH
ncbi:MAG: hypothetical protein WB005_12260, partial [Pseudolabrys sp.]